MLNINQSTGGLGLSIDVEDWFHILDSDQTPPIFQWETLESRVERNTLLILDLLDQHSLKATFFILGWVAERHPQIVEQIVDRGHEIGSHGHLHLMVSQLTPDEFARDLDASLTAISRAAQQDVLAYRAPGFSIQVDQFWAFKILASRGIRVDSSLFAGRHAHGGIAIARSRPFEIVLPNGQRLLEFPITPFPIFKVVPVSGGGYLRLLPTALARHLFKLAHKHRWNATTYVHPRDFDVYQPRLDLDPVRSFKHYVGLKTFTRKFTQILKVAQFNALRDVAAKAHFDQPLVLDL